MRKEKDLLGEKLVPKEVYYGIQTVRAIENFPISGQKLREELIIALGQVKRASAIANRKLGLLSEDLANPIITACDEVIAGKLTSQFLVDPIQGGAGTSINMNANEVIANRAIQLCGEKLGDYSYISPNTHVNMSQSTNDVFPTAIRIATMKMSEGLLQSISKLIKELRKKAKEFDHVIKVARTHLQDAVPIRLGQEFASYQHLIERDRNRIKMSLRHLLKINMGATATGTGLNTPIEYREIVLNELKAYSGLKFELASDLVDATQNIDTLAELSGALKIMAVDLSKIANDLRLLSSGPRAGLNEINLPSVQPGSSIMPGKVNPVIPEVVNQVSFQVIGNDTTITMALEAGQLELNVMEPIVAHNLFESIDMLRNVIEVFAEKAIAGVTANEKLCEKYLKESLGLITAVNPYLGYEKTSDLAKEVISTNKTVSQALVDNNIVSEEDIHKLLSPYELTKGGLIGEEIFNEQKN
ncbi:aspartate ammonia-lyase [Desulfitispora alkaliphila]|uniref:aspartate ammonia-lyase n=1 Tax=Desulfitispora alkaliphila TaxID=622674 RepID=UPI003D21CE51